MPISKYQLIAIILLPFLVSCARDSLLRYRNDNVISCRFRQIKVFYFRKFISGIYTVYSYIDLPICCSVVRGQMKIFFQQLNLNKQFHEAKTLRPSLIFQILECWHNRNEEIQKKPCIFNEVYACTIYKNWPVLHKRFPPRFSSVKITCFCKTQLSKSLPFHKLDICPAIYNIQHWWQLALAVACISLDIQVTDKCPLAFGWEFVYLIPNTRPCRCIYLTDIVRIAWMHAVSQTVVLPTIY